MKDYKTWFHNGEWFAEIKKNGQWVIIGTFKTRMEAITAIEESK